MKRKIIAMTAGFFCLSLIAVPCDQSLLLTKKKIAQAKLKAASNNKRVYDVLLVDPLSFSSLPATGYSN